MNNEDAKKIGPPFPLHPQFYSTGKIKQKIEFDGKKIVINIFTGKPSVRVPAMSIKKLHAPQPWEMSFLPPF